MGFFLQILNTLCLRITYESASSNTDAQHKSRIRELHFLLPGLTGRSVSLAEAVRRGLVCFVDGESAFKS